ncbi:MAG: hypothetical protein U9Q04_07695 [Campylobacterota bacterium]|nr:hypothetical protein [Campylobacterota bacterium]
MDYEDRLEYIKKLQSQGYKHEKSQSLVINNFYMLITIVIISVFLTIYVTYILPQKEEEKYQTVKNTQHQEYMETRQKQIALSHKLNKIENNNTK